LDPGHLAGGAELAPAHAVVAVVHQGGMRPAFPHPALLGGAVVLWVRPGVIVMEAHAPAAAKDAVVARHQRGERGPRRLVEGPHGVRRFGHKFNLTRPKDISLSGPNQRRRWTFGLRQASPDLHAVTTLVTPGLHNHPLACNRAGPLRHASRRSPPEGEKR